MSEVTKITGYRGLSDDEIALINEGKELATAVGRYIDKLMAIETTDKRNVSLAKTNLQQGFMWAARSVARPLGF